MKHIIQNPHNGQPVSAHGVSLLPGMEQEVKDTVAQALKATYAFLHHKQVEGKPSASLQKAKPAKIKGTLNWGHTAHDESDPQPQQVIHELKGGSKPVATNRVRAKVKRAR